MEFLLGTLTSDLLRTWRQFSLCDASTSDFPIKVAPGLQ